MLLKEILAKYNKKFNLDKMCLHFITHNIYKHSTHPYPYMYIHYHVYRKNVYEIKT